MSYLATQNKFQSFLQSIPWKKCRMYSVYYNVLQKGLACQN